MAVLGTTEFNVYQSINKHKITVTTTTKGPNQVYSVSLTVSETTFRGEPERYRRVLRSFKTRLSAKGTPPPNSAPEN